MRTIIILLTIISTLSAAQIVELAGDKGYPPYSYTQKAKAKGVYVDVLKAAFKKLPDYEVKFNMMAWKRAIKLTKEGKVIGFFPPYYGIERTKWTKYSEPILAESTIVFAKEETLKGKKRYPEDFYGLKVCLNRGFNIELLGGKKFKEAIDSKKLAHVEGNDNKACLSRVARGLADFYINDQLVDTSMFPMIKKGMKAVDNFGHIGYTLKTKNYPFINDLEMKLNKIIKQMKQNGEIEQIVKKYR